MAHSSIWTNRSAHQRPANSPPLVPCMPLLSPSRLCACSVCCRGRRSWSPESSPELPSIFGREKKRELMNSGGYSATLTEGDLIHEWTKRACLASEDHFLLPYGCSIFCTEYICAAWLKWLFSLPNKASCSCGCKCKRHAGYQMPP